MNFATWTNRVINESSEQYFAEELLEESIAKTLKPVVNKMKKLNIGVPYRDARLFFFNYLQDMHPDVIPAEFQNSKRKPSAKDVNAMVGQIAINNPEALDTFANEFEAYATGTEEGSDEDRVSEFLRIAMVLRTGKNVRPKKDEGYKTKEYSGLTPDDIKSATMDAIEKVPVEKGEDVDVKDEKLMLKLAFSKVLAQLGELDELNPQVLVNIANTGKKIDSIDTFKQFLDYMHQYEEYHLAEAYLRDMIAVLEKEVAGMEDEEGLDDFHTQRQSDEDIPEYLEDLHAMRAGKFPGMKKKRKVVDYDTSYAPVYGDEDNEAKPDYLDLDGDGDKEESMKKAAEDKKHASCEDAENGCTCEECPDCADNKKRHEDESDAADGAMKGIKAKERLNYIDNIVFTYEGRDLDWYKKVLFKNPQFKDKKLTPYELKVLERAMKESAELDEESENEPLAKDTDDARDKGGKLYQGNRHGQYNKRTGKWTSNHERMLNRKSSKSENEEGGERAGLDDEFKLTPDEMEKARGMADFNEDDWFFSPGQNLYFRKREGGEDQESTSHYMSKAPVEKREEAEEVRMSQQEINRLLATRERERVQNLYAQQRRYTQGY